MWYMTVSVSQAVTQALPTNCCGNCTRTFISRVVLENHLVAILTAYTKRNFVLAHVKAIM